MKNLLYGTLFLALVGITFVGCEKSDDETDNYKTVKTRSVYNDYELSFLEIKKNCKSS